MFQFNRSNFVQTLLFAISLLTVVPANLNAQNGTMRGFADIHNHQFANMAFGGYVVAGKPYGPISDALSELECRKGHSSNHSFDILGGALAGYTLLGLPVAITYPNDGYANFSGWPQFFEVSHQKVHEDFLYRAVQGGLRLMVMMAVESPILCKAVGKGGGKTDGRNCNDEMSSINMQLEAAYQMQKYIDQKAGGTGLGWYRIVTTPRAAREVIGQGKLAVVLGVETSHLFNCAAEPCDWQGQLTALWNLGVRHFFPIHQDKNAFGGPSFFQKSIQNGPTLLGVEAYKFPTYYCGDRYGKSPHNVASNTQCDSLGLTDTGKSFIQGLMNLGAVIDVDHMSDRSFADTLTLTEAIGYPVVASHAGFNEINQRDQDHEGQLTNDELGRIQRSGGMVGLISSQGDISTVGTYKRPGANTIEHNCGRSTETFAQAYYYALDHAPGMPIAIGTDLNGALRQVGPRFGSNACNGDRSGRPDSTTKLPVSFLARGSGELLSRSVVGNRTFDFNVDGLAHIGLLPDMFADLEVLGIAPDDLEPLFNSAEGYVQTWERAQPFRDGQWADVDGDGKKDYCRLIGSANLVDSQIECTLSSIGGGAKSTSAVLDWGYDAGRSWVDVNGDGKADFCRVGGAPGNAYVMCTLSTGSGFGATITSGNLDWGYNSGRAWVDVNGDGKADYCRVGGAAGNAYVMCTLSTGTGFGVTIGSGNLDWGYEDGRTWVDVNGDGKADYCRVGGGPGAYYLICTLSTGSGFGATVSSGNIDLGYEAGRAWVDVNGDGKADYCRVAGGSGNKYVICTLSTGYGFGSTIASGNLDWGYEAGRAWVDVDGDGKADYCRVGGDLSNRYVMCTLSTGSGFGATIGSGNLDWGYNYGRAWVDATGDHKADYCRVGGDSANKYMTCTRSTGLGFGDTFTVVNLK